MHERLATTGPAQQGPLIEVKELGKTYRVGRDEIAAIESISFQLRRGEFLSVVGPSGCGKTTLLKILAGLLPLSKGQVLVEGRPLKGTHPGIGVVFQEPVLMPWRNVLDNVLLPVEVRGSVTSRTRDKAEELLKLVGLAGFSKRRIWELSGGMQQRVAIARALVNDPVLLLMDEPFAALDALTREQMNAELKRICLATDITAFFITHSLSEAVFLSDRVLVLSPRPTVVRTIVDIDLGSRTPEVVHSDRFGEFVRQIRSQILDSRNLGENAHHES